MASEKAIYWTAVGVLALAVMNGFVSEYRGWASRLADKSIAVVEQASEMAAGYVNLAAGRENDGFKPTERAVVRAQVRLARVQNSLARHQAEMARVQAQGIRAQVMERGIQTVIACPRQNLVITVPQPPQISEDGTF
jgi:hypothetical protein